MCIRDSSEPTVASVLALPALSSVAFSENGAAFEDAGVRHFISPDTLDWRAVSCDELSGLVAAATRALGPGEGQGVPGPALKTGSLRTLLRGGILVPRPRLDIDPTNRDWWRGLLEPCSEDSERAVSSPPSPPMLAPEG